MVCLEVYLLTAVKMLFERRLNYKWRDRNLIVSDIVFYKRPVNVMIESVGRLSFATRWTWPLSEAMPE